jgi:hypothetical protein
MMKHDSRRRELITVLFGSAAAAGLLASSVRPAAAYQGNMERALEALNQAFVALRESTPNKGGHRERAMQMVNSAMAEVQAGIDFANAHGGGGY